MVKSNSTHNNSSKTNKSESMKYPLFIHLSYGLGGFLIHFLAAALAVRIIFFYENVLLLDIVLIGIVFVIFGFWNMINDPLIGYFSDRPTRFTQRWGRRFPWFLTTVFPCCVFYLLIYLVPFRDTIGMFVWLLAILCAFEFTFSAFNTSYLALFPEKFKSNKERMRVAGISTIAGQIGIAMGIIIPPLLIKPNNLNSYIYAACIVMIIGLIFSILMIPGMREGEELRTFAYQQVERGSFLLTLKIALKQKNFNVYLYVYFAHSIMTVMMLSSIPFWTVYVIETDNPTLIEAILAATFLIAGMASVPMWVKIGRKYGNRKGFMYGTLLTSIFFIPLLFISDILLSVITIGALGVGIGAIWTLIPPCLSDVIDESVIITNKRQEAFYTGIRTFFGRFAIVVQGIAFALVHTITFYKPGAKTQKPLAIMGIRILMAGIPMIFYFIGFLALWFFYDLTPERVKVNQNLLRERGL
jgi:GPH family glycoside/pentoside/hexuronide:cation symporter